LQSHLVGQCSHLPACPDADDRAARGSQSRQHTRPHLTAEGEDVVREASIEPVRVGGILDTSASMTHLPPQDAGEADDDRQIQKDHDVRQRKSLVHRAEVVPVSDPVRAVDEPGVHLIAEGCLWSDVAGRVVAVQIEMDDGNS